MRRGASGPERDGRWVRWRRGRGGRDEMGEGCTRALSNPLCTGKERVPMVKAKGEMAKRWPGEDGVGKRLVRGGDTSTHPHPHAPCCAALQCTVLCCAELCCSILPWLDLLRACISLLAAEPAFSRWRAAAPGVHRRAGRPTRESPLSPTHSLRRRKFTASPPPVCRPAILENNANFLSFSQRCNRTEC